MSMWAMPGVKCTKFRQFTPPEYRDFPFRQPPNPVPIGAIATINLVYFDEQYGIVRICLDEFPLLHKGVDVGWWVGNFKPLTPPSLSDDVALFEAILRELDPRKILEEV